MQTYEQEKLDAPPAPRTPAGVPSALGTQHSALHPVAWLVWAGTCTLAVATTRNPLYLALVALCAGAAFRAARTGQSSRGAAQWSLVLRAAWTLTAIAILFNTLTVHAGDRVLVTLPRGVPLLGPVAGGPV